MDTLGVSATPSASIFVQDACYQHRYIRSKDTSLIVERAERLTAVKVGLAAAITRIREAVDAGGQGLQAGAAGSGDELADALNKLTLGSSDSNTITSPIHVIHSSATLDILTHPAVQFVHGFPDPNLNEDVKPNEYLMNLKQWSEDSIVKISKGESEIPIGLAQGDLYLCPESIAAIQGSLGTVCECVNYVVNPDPSTSKRAFVAIRPPGHHCGESTPSGFCFVNNVVVAAAHAHLEHGIHRVVIFDIDLHHGNGTQSIVWEINEATERKRLEAEAMASASASSATGPSTSNPASAPTPTPTPGLQIYYSSIHDILSYPCEDGKLSLVQAASMSIRGEHGQWIENVHLREYDSQEQGEVGEDGGFWGIYEKEYKSIIRKAERFVECTAGSLNEEVLVFISCGFDASEHEYPSMSRHNRKVPTSFFAKFTQDARAFAEKYAKGRIISILEGGYSDRALISGTLAHFWGMGVPDDLGRFGWGFEPLHTKYTWNETWWEEQNLVKLENAMKSKVRGKSRKAALRFSQTTDSEPEAPSWLQQTLSLFDYLEPVPIKSISTRGVRKVSAPIEPSSRTLRQRKPESASTPNSKPTTPAKGDELGKRRGVPKTKTETNLTAASISLRSSGKSSLKTGKQTVVIDAHHEQGSDSDSSSSTLSSVPESIGDIVSESNLDSERRGDIGSHVEGVGDAGSSITAAPPKKLPRVILKLGPQPS